MKRRSRKQLYFSESQFPGDDIKYIVPTWKETGKLTFQVARQIIDSRYKIDRVIALAKGGWTWLRALTDYLAVSRASSFEVKFYLDVNKKNKMPVIVQSLPISIEGEKVLLFDDVADSGSTLRVAKEYLRMCGAKEIKIATLFYKPWSTVEPDFWGYKTEAWVVFPHEIREAIREIGARWRRKGVEEKKIISYFREMGIPKNEISFFLNLEKIEGKGQD